MKFISSSEYAGCVPVRTPGEPVQCVRLLFKSLGCGAADQKAVTGSGNLSNCDGRDEGNLDPVTTLIPTKCILGFCLSEILRSFREYA